MEGKLHTPLARQQDGLVTRRQLLDLGWGRTAIDGAVRRGWLHRVHAGLYSVSPRLTRWTRWRAAHLATGGAVSHVSAAAMHGLLPDRRLDVEVITTSRDEQRILTADRRGRKGRPSLAALQRRLVDRTRTELEATMPELCARAELPRPSRQHRIGRSTPLATRGWTVLRFTHRQLHKRPELVLRALRARLAEA